MKLLSINDKECKELLSLCDKLPCDFYDVVSLIRLCDDSANYIYTSGINSDTKYVNVSTKFFIRTFEGNYIVVDKQHNTAIFSPPDVVAVYNNLPLNDYILLSARDILTTVFHDTPRELIGAFCIPTPFGVRKTDSGFEIVMQLCYNTNSELKLPEEYELVPFDNYHAEGVSLILKTVKRTKR